MAPEVIDASVDSPYDPFKADIWSIGVVTFCMVFGFIPWIIEEGVDDPEQAIYDLVREGFTPGYRMDGDPSFPENSAKRRQRLKVFRLRHWI